MGAIASPVSFKNLVLIASYSMTLRLYLDPKVANSSIPICVISTFCIASYSYLNLGCIATVYIKL